MKPVIVFSVGIMFLGACKEVVEKDPASPHEAYSTTNKKVIVYTTADSTSFRLTATDTLAFSDAEQPLESQAFVIVDPSHSFQTFSGIGGALTDAAAETLAKLPPDKQETLIQSYYDTSKGIGYSLGRINMNSCDFSSDMYTYVKEGDSALSSFDIAHDYKYKIPLIKKALTAAGGKLSLYISPWSPPAWMKDNNNVLHGGKLKPAYYQSWANYYIKYIQALEKEHIPVWGLTVQNEPMATQIWESCIYTAEEERDFIKNFLGPALQNNNMSDKRLMAWDHNRDLLYQRASTVLNDPETAKYVWGIGFHWYERGNGGPQYENLKLMTETFPGKNLILTEGANGDFNLKNINDWNLGESYGSSMINDFNNGVVGWTDWNILLDETGGPNHVGNFSFSPVHANIKQGTLNYCVGYYYIGHFSKFIHPGAKRVVSSTNRVQLLTTAFMNQDGKLTVVVMNPTAEKYPYKMFIGKNAIELTSLPHSIASLIVMNQ